MMDSTGWASHLDKWREYLYTLLSETEDRRARRRIERELAAIERVRMGAATNPAVLREFAAPSQANDSAKELNSTLLTLNASQKTAVEQALSDRPLTLIQGPPGTGKTQVIAEICLQVLANDPGARILVCSETHVAVNNLISRMTPYSGSTRMLRIRDREGDEGVAWCSPTAIISSYLDWARKNAIDERMLGVIEDEFRDASRLEAEGLTRRMRSLEKALILSSNVVGMTCNMAGAYDFLGAHESFDLAIVDEACKATLPALLIPLLICKKAVLVGDPQQLPPVFCTEEIDVLRRIRQCDLRRHMHIDRLFESRGVAVKLDTQYRMSRKIGDMISATFYDGEIRLGRHDSHEGSLSWVDYRPTRSWPVSSCANDERPEIYNDDECSIVERIVEEELQRNESSRIAVISPYRAQVERLRCRMAAASTPNVEIGTIDSFQGKEADAVVFSVTRTHGPYSFFADKKRLNVALSRAKYKIVIVGCIQYCRVNPLLLSIINVCDVTTSEV